VPPVRHADGADHRADGAAAEAGARAAPRRPPAAGRLCPLVHLCRREFAPHRRGGIFLSISISISIHIYISIINIHPLLADFVLWCTSADASLRPTVEEVSIYLPIYLSIHTYISMLYVNIYMSADHPLLADFVLWCTSADASLHPTVEEVSIYLSIYLSIYTYIHIYVICKYIYERRPPAAGRLCPLAHFGRRQPASHRRGGIYLSTYLSIYTCISISIHR